MIKDCVREGAPLLLRLRWVGQNLAIIERNLHQLPEAHLQGSMSAAGFSNRLQPSADLLKRLLVGNWLFTRITASAEA